MGLYNMSIALFFCIEFVILIFSIKYKKKKLLLMFFLILLSFTYSKMIQSKYDKAFINNESYYLARVESVGEKVKNYNRYILKIKSGKYKNYKILFYTKRALEYGTIIKFFEEIEKPEHARNDKRI